MRLPWIRGGMVLGIAAIAACSRDQPTATLHSISGRLRLTGYLVAPNGAYAGTKVVGNPDGVPVELVHGTEVVARTTTSGGAYQFSGLRAGGYFARSMVVGGIGDQTTPMVIARSDVSAADTIRLVSRGDLTPVPNPFVDTTQVYFVVPGDTTQLVRVDVRVLDVGYQAIKDLLNLEVRPKRHAVYWSGRDQGGHPMPSGFYWVTYVAGNDVRAHLLFKQGP